MRAAFSFTSPSVSVPDTSRPVASASLAPSASEASGAALRATAMLGAPPSLDSEASKSGSLSAAWRTTLRTSAGRPGPTKDSIAQSPPRAVASTGPGPYWTESRGLRPASSSRTLARKPARWPTETKLPCGPLKVSHRYFSSLATLLTASACAGPSTGGKSTVSPGASRSNAMRTPVVNSSMLPFVLNTSNGPPSDRAEAAAELSTASGGDTQ
mmetsp:Transcript_25457/g.67920  ORF Transcript_25457/g.67920 Transcript_25457/m.67920 type:complete len:213 (+) Transcript_25457:385-1023(+)